jgi:hypothetical protein
MRSLVTLLILLLAVIGVVAAHAHEEAAAAAPLRIPRVSRPPKLSDFLNDTPREAELVISDFRQYTPGDGTPVTQPTKAYLSYDDKNLYVAFVFKDDPNLIRARLAKRELIMSDDRISICIDTFNDHRHMYWFDVNPYGVQADGNVTDGVEDDPSWDTLWHSEARITEDGYVGLAAIPFKSIRFPSEEEQIWGLILIRWITRNNESSTWPYVSRRRPGFVQQGGDITGIRGISPGRNIQLIPYGLFAHSRFLEDAPPAMPGYQNDTEARVGLDAKAVLKDAFTLDVTLNPDFSQVESDEPQVTVNQRFEVVYPEKRPFFMENGGYFKTPQQLFFSRRIVDPQFGVRLTGKVGTWALGALAVDDRAPGEMVSPDDAQHGKKAGIGVVRLQKELRGNSNLAVMATSWDFGPAYNRVYSLDTRLQLLPNWILTGQAMSSDTRLTDGGQLSGPAYYLKWAHSGEHLISETAYSDRSPGFRAELGYFNRVDIREASQTFGYMWRPEGGTLVSFGPKLKGAINYDHKGRLQDWSVNPEFEIELTRMTKIALERWDGFELFANRGFRKYHNEAEITSEWQRWLSLAASFSSGSSVNYYPAQGLEPFLGNLLEAQAGFTLLPNARIKIEESYIYNALTTNSESGVADVPPGTTIYNNHIARSKVNYQFSREMSLRFIVDYQSVLPNSTLVDLEKDKHFGVDVLFTYMLNPGTALYVGYTDLYDNWRLDPARPPNLFRTDFPGLNTGRQFFFKLSYLLRF